jgi:two-component system response regulator FlrC
MNILIVDDNRMILNSLSSYFAFRLKDYTVLTAEDGRKAIDVMKTHPISLVLTDLEMPHVDGYQVVEYTKKHHPAVPLIIMTGSWSIDLEMLVQKMGVARCIQKPFRFEELGDLAIEALVDHTEIPRA